jgi:hypothetical protein
MEMEEVEQFEEERREAVASMTLDQLKEKNAELFERIVARSHDDPPQPPD